MYISYSTSKYKNFEDIYYSNTNKLSLNIKFIVIFEMNLEYNLGSKTSKLTLSNVS